KGRIAKMVQRTRVGGGEIVNLLGTSAWYAPGAAAGEIVDAVLLDEKRILPCTALLEGEYGIDGLYMGVPVKLGAAGIEEIVELDLPDEEQRWLGGAAWGARGGGGEVVGVCTTNNPGGSGLGKPGPYEPAAFAAGPHQRHINRRHDSHMDL